MPRLSYIRTIPPVSKTWTTTEAFRMTTEDQPEQDEHAGLFESEGDEGKDEEEDE